MVEKCYECSAPVAEGQTYCPKCQDEDDNTVQLKVINNDLPPAA